MDAAPPEYPRPTSLPPGRSPYLALLTLGYHGNKPSISLMGIYPEAFGDVSSPPCGRAVGMSDLHNLEARHRFAVFGSSFVASERLRQSRRAGTIKENKPAAGALEAYKREGLKTRCCVTKRFAKIYATAATEKF
jgi:hypothetical protein